MIQKENTYTLPRISKKINEVIDKLNPILPEGKKSSKDTKAGDICYVKNGKKFFCTADEWNDSLGTPIGVVVVPSSHNEDGSSTIMSLCNMNCLDPEHGGVEVYNQDNPDDFESKYCMCWGDPNKAIPGITQSTLQPVVDPITGTSTGTVDVHEAGNCLFASDVWLDENIQEILVQMLGQAPLVQGVDTESVYLDEDVIGALGYIPSPYLADGSKNPEYNVEDTAFKAKDGKADTDSIIALTTKYLTGQVAHYDADEGSYPAATCCHRFYTEGTNAGDWYLPSIAETGYIAARIMAINKSLVKLGNKAIEIGTIMEEINGYMFGYWLWSSTEITEYDAWGYFSDSLGCYSHDEYGYYDNGRVRALMSVK